MSSIRVFPQHLPAALVAGHGFEPQPNARQRERDQGEMRLRPRWRSVPEHCSVTWLLDQDGFDAFDAWFEDSLKAGTGDFDVRVQHRGTQWGTTWYTAMFLGGVYGCDVVPSATGLMYRVTASLQLIEELGPVRVSPGITATMRTDYRLTARTTAPPIAATMALDYTLTAKRKQTVVGAQIVLRYGLTWAAPVVMEDAVLLFEDGTDVQAEDGLSILVEHSVLAPPVAPSSFLGARFIAAGAGRLLVTTYGGSNPLLVSSDDGASYALVSDGIRGAFVDRDRHAALADGSYMSLYLNIDAGQAGQITGDLSDLPASIAEAINSNGIFDWQDWHYYGWPRSSSGAVIVVFAAMADGSYFYVVGQYADPALPQGRRLWRANADLVFTEIGAMQADPSDPNAEPGLLSWDGSFAALPSGKLKRMRGRWWLIHRFAAFYTDDPAGLTGWRRAPTQFESGMASRHLLLIRDVVEVGDSLVALRSDTALLGPHIAVSTDDGDSWTAHHLEFLGLTGTISDEFSAFGDELILYPVIDGGQVAVHAAEPFTDWQFDPVNGLLASERVAFLWPSASRLAMISSYHALYYSADGVHFTAAAVT